MSAPSLKPAWIDFWSQEISTKKLTRALGWYSTKIGCQVEVINVLAVPFNLFLKRSERGCSADQEPNTRPCHLSTEAFPGQLIEP